MGIERTIMGDSIMAYSVMISEQQRQIILAALDNCKPDFLQNCGEDAVEELLTLCELIEELPEIEKESPGVLHGLCL